MHRTLYESFVLALTALARRRATSHTLNPNKNA